MTSKEALNLLSFMKLGIDLGFFPDGLTGPSSTNSSWRPNRRICRKAPSRNCKLRNGMRCAPEIIREKLKQFPEPDIGHSPETGERKQREAR